ncbi:aminomethyltransferase, mitochondrial [Neocloeon triangulifer]|uniref:aminomethyltransferase, mitochondrial n=1 Tax=Neocloeon triangulifer TaxID=2078957 RepID=UPI00286EB981|nr:aminomethyltransferase, mitochondrial [Neocloeon triangulifer]
MLSTLSRVARQWVRPLAVRQAATEAADGPRKTCLYDFHVKRGGRMVDFAGFLLPVQYTEGMSASHRHVREHCGLFDVSHMLQTEVRGKDRLAFVESLCVADLHGLPDNGATLSVLTTHSGGVVDDLVITKTPLGYIHMVSNAARRKEVSKLLADAREKWAAKGKDVVIKHYVPEDWALLALQGPKAAAALQPLVDIDLAQLRFMTSSLAAVDGHERCRVTRCGYTGEDGFEVCIPASISVPVSEQLLACKSGRVQLAGLGVRDSLRIEAGLCLYGAELSEEISPIEAGLTWLVAKRRREAADFPGASSILQQIRQGPARRRVGLRSQGAPARAGAVILDLKGTQVGHVTSGCPSPSLGGNVAMGFVQAAFAKATTRLQLLVRNKAVDAEVTKMPFVKTNYYTPDKKK